MPKKVHIEITDLGTVIVQGVHIQQTNIVIYSAWESTRTLFGDHTVMSLIDGHYRGKIGTRRFGVPFAMEAAKTFYKSQERMAHDCIYKAFPHLTRSSVIAYAKVRQSGHEIVEIFQSVFDAKASCEEV